MSATAVTAPKEKEIIFVTGNKNKLREVNQILGPVLPNGWTIVNTPIDLPEIQESDPVEVTRAKCLEAAKQVAEMNGGRPVPVITEDTSLCFDALGGLPGPFIKWFIQKMGTAGLPRLLAGFEDKGACALCTFAVCMGHGQEVVIFQGRCPGSIVDTPRGSSGFGWDPIFQPTDGQKEGAPLRTFAEMGADKNAISHRKKALDALEKWVSEHTELFP